MTRFMPSEAVLNNLARECSSECAPWCVHKLARALLTILANKELPVEVADAPLRDRIEVAMTRAADEPLFGVPVEEAVAITMKFVREVSGVLLENEQRAWAKEVRREQGRAEHAYAALVEMQKHRDAWRRYAETGGDRPNDYLDGNKVKL